MPNVTRRGKIARLPHTLRESLNQRLLDNEDGPTILAWLNKTGKLYGPAAISPQNLSEWRGGGFADWLQKQDKVERTKQLSEYCLRMAEAGGGSMDLPAAIAGGQLMEVLEAFDPDNLKGLLADKPENWIGILGQLAKLQIAKANEKKVGQQDIKLAMDERALALDEAKFQVSTCTLFLKWYADKRAAEIAADKSSKPDVKIAELRQLMFGAVIED